MAMYEVKQTIQNMGIGLKRQPGQFVSDGEMRSVLGWRDALLKTGAIVPVNESAQPEAKEKKAVRHAV